MPFNLEDSNINRKGRPKGSISYSTKLRSHITEFCEENLNFFLNEIKSMKNGHAKANAFLTLLNYALPKLTETNAQIEMDRLTEKEIDIIFKRLTEHETFK